MAKSSSVRPGSKRRSRKFSPEELSLRGRLAAHVLHSKYDGKQLTDKARRTFRESFQKKVGPEGKLPEAERQRRAEHAYQAHMAQVALASVRARRKKAGQ